MSMGMCAICEPDLLSDLQWKIKGVKTICMQYTLFSCVSADTLALVWYYVEFVHL